MSQQLDRSTQTIMTRIAADGVRNPYECAPAHGAEALAFILNSIDTCVLARSLTFEVNGIARFIAHVRTRTLYRITDPGRNVPQIVCDTADALPKLQEFLMDICAQATHIKITPLPKPEAFTAVQTGLPSQQLLDYFDTAPPPAAQLDVLATRPHGQVWRIARHTPALPDAIVWADQLAPEDWLEECLSPQDMLLFQAHADIGLALALHGAALFASPEPFAEDRCALWQALAEHSEPT